MQDEENKAMTKHYDVITLFPEMFDAITKHGITSRALQQKIYDLQLWNPRDFTSDNHKTVDDRPYGGGPGMVMKAEPLNAAINAAMSESMERQKYSAQENVNVSPVTYKPKVVYLTPQAKPITDVGIRELVKEPGLIFLCGRYEGIDERLINARVDLEVSIGDYVLSGGELAAMVLIDAMVRLLPGVLNSAESAIEDSFSPARNGLLDHPHYTRPEVWNEQMVPAALMSGNHVEIAEWRHQAARARTLERRPDLLADVADKYAAKKN